jgi:glycosyltransferase involved in cell wall biosynthesis
VKVAHVINRLAPGGSERQLLEVVARSRHESHIVELEKSDGRGSLRRRLEALRPDVVVAWLVRPQILVAATRVGKPTVAAIRGLAVYPSLRHKVLVQAAYATFDAFVSNSEAVRTSVREFARPLELHPFWIIPNGVEMTTYARPQNRSGPLRIGFIGRGLDPDKGLDILLAALDLLPRDAVHVTLVGKDVEVAAARAASDCNLSAHGPTPTPWTAVGEIDVLVVPSRREGSPNVVLEAFARGVPVIGSAVGGLGELLAEGRGVCVRAGDPSALHDAIAAFAPEAEAGGNEADRARQYVRKHAWPRVIAAWEAMLERVAAGL